VPRHAIADERFLPADRIDYATMLDIVSQHVLESHAKLDAWGKLRIEFPEHGVAEDEPIIRIEQSESVGEALERTGQQRLLLGYSFELRERCCGLTSGCGQIAFELFDIVLHPSPRRHRRDH
jgi:hypothetical protein